MPRAARRKSESGIYHIILRGHNRQTVFLDNEDKIKFLETLSMYKEESRYRIYGYCLMDNHIHLLLHDQEENLGLIMRRIGSRYVYWYNYKYKRCGHLFQDRFRSEAVETDAYLLTVLRYIHNNPRKAGLVKDFSEYKWSSYNDYINNKGITDTDYVLGMFNDDRMKAVEGFIELHDAQDEDKCLDIDYKIRLTDEEAREIIKRVCGLQSALDLQSFDAEKRKASIELLKKRGISTRQLVRLTGISRYFILKP